MWSNQDCPPPKEIGGHDEQITVYHSFFFSLLINYLLHELVSWNLRRWMILNDVEPGYNFILFLVLVNFSYNMFAPERGKRITCFWAEVYSLGWDLPTINSSVVCGVPGYGFHPSQGVLTLPVSGLQFPIMAKFEIKLFARTPGVSCIPRTKYVRGILWFSRRYAASASASAASAASASADTSSFSR